MFEPREFRCDCGGCVMIWSPGADGECDRCDQTYNAFGQKVHGALHEIDYMAAGEEW